jgi:NDP-sugar pyrophosphorylase family protein
LHSPFGIVRFDDANRALAFDEKPTLPYCINIGFIHCEPEAFSHLKPGSDIPAFLASLIEAGGLYTYQHTGKHLTVNTEKERAHAEVELVEFFTYMDGQKI